MPRFFVPSANFDGDTVRITGDDARHIARALRMAVGETVTVCDMHGNAHICELVRITDAESTLKILSSRPSDTEPPLRTVLYQAFPKGDKMDYIVQKAVEEGVYAVVPFMSERCISRPDGAAVEKKIARWQRIALEAAKQCGRGVVPTVRSPLTYAQMLDEASHADIPCFCYEGDGTRSLREVLQTAHGEVQKSASAERAGGRDLSLVVGCEGGFSLAEAADAAAHGFALCALGKRILRCESASGFALACISYEFEL